MRLDYNVALELRTSSRLSSLRDTRGRRGQA